MALPKLNKNALLLVGALALGLVAALLSISYVQKRVDAATAALAVKTVDVPVVVTKRDLHIGELLAEADLAVREIPEDLVPADAITPDSYGEMINRMVRAPVRAGAPLSGASLVPLYDQFSRVIGLGKVGYTISVDDINSISGMLAPGDAVDILLTLGETESGDRSALLRTEKEGKRVVPLMENVRVLATGQRVGETMVQDGNQSFSNITFELSPSQAEQLELASATGEIRLILRNLDDTTPFGLAGLTEKSLKESLGGMSSDGVEYIIGSK